MHSESRFGANADIPVLLLAALLSTGCAGVTHLGVAPDSHVRLVGRTPAESDQYIRFSRVHRDGTAEFPWFVPAGRVLVLTDFEYTLSNDVAGRSVECPLYRDHGIVNPVLIPVIVLGGTAGTSAGAVPIVSHVALTSGVVVDTHDGLVADSLRCGQHRARLTALGYLLEL
jgi:hypothetical protein